MFLLPYWVVLFALLFLDVDAMLEFPAHGEIACAGFFSIKLVRVDTGSRTVAEIAGLPAVIFSRCLVEVIVGVLSSKIIPLSFPLVTGLYTVGLFNVGLFELSVFAIKDRGEIEPNVLSSY